MTNDIPVSLDLVLNQLRYFLPVVLNGCCGSRFHKSYPITACSMFNPANAITNIESAGKIKEHSF